LIDRTLEETGKLIRTGMKLLARPQEQTRKMKRGNKYSLHALKESQRRSDAIFVAFLNRRPPTG
jgi:hypothetical protein